jgi:hypothetical protein
VFVAYCFTIAFAALRVGAYRFALREVVPCVTSITWVAVFILYLVAYDWLQRLAHVHP